MKVSVVGRLLLLGALLALPVAAFAQEATLTGAVTDSTGGVLPGVTVTAVLEATGNRFETVTDERGVFRMPVRVGIYNLAAELQGFATVTRTGLQLLAGQTATINLQMAPVHGAGNRDGHRGIAAARCRHLESGRQHRSAAGDRDAVRRPQLDGAADAGAGQPVHVGQSLRAARNPEREPDARVPDERRRHAVRQHDGRRRPAGVQPGDDRRVPVHLEPVRRDAGPLVGRAGEHDHQVGHEPVRRLVPRQLPRRPLQCREPGAARASCRSRTSSSRVQSAGRSGATGCTSSSSTSTSARRRPRSGTRRSRSSTWRSTARPPSSTSARASTTSSRRRRA